MCVCVPCDCVCVVTMRFSLCPAHLAVFLHYLYLTKEPKHLVRDALKNVYLMFQPLNH